MFTTRLIQRNYMKIYMHFYNTYKRFVRYILEVTVIIYLRRRFQYLTYQKPLIFLDCPIASVSRTIQSQLYNEPGGCAFTITF